MGGITLADEDVLALEVVIDIAKHGLAKGSHIASRQGLHPRYLERLLHRLARRGMLQSERGRLGGYQLARDAALIRASDVVRAARSRSDQTRKHGSPAVKQLIKQLEEHAFASLQRVTIAALAFQHGDHALAEGAPIVNWETMTVA
jgi:Rrf2 family protein